jgi:hypothetical protein
VNPDRSVPLEPPVVPFADGNPREHKNAPQLIHHLCLATPRGHEAAPTRPHSRPIRARQ